MKKYDFSQYSDKIIKPGLERIKLFLRKLGNPQDKFSSILVGGTNGKGSTVSYLYHLLNASGVKVGAYLSPHLIQLRERIKIPERLEEEDIEDVLAELEKKSQKWKVDLSPFELFTAAVFMVFQNLGIDLAILEVGMGGRWDATNVTDPIASLVVSVGMDHTRYLGRNIEAIACEKFLIARPGKPLIVGLLPLPALRVFRDMGTGRGVPIDEYQRGFTVIPETKGFCYVGYRVIPHLLTGMEGRHQWVNAALAIRTLEVLEMPLVRAAQALKETKLPGRFQVEEFKGVTLVLDVAHNPLALETLIGALKERFPKRPLWVVFQLLRDKPYKEMVKLLERNFERFFHVPLDLGGRGLKDKEVVGRGIDGVRKREEWLSLLERAREQGAVLVVTGCFGVVKEVNKWLHGNGSF